MLKFSCGNSKLNALANHLELHHNQVVCFDLPAGWTCPCADICFSKANRDTGHITDGKNCKIRCYAASGEALYPQARKLRWHNYDTLRESTDMVDTILSSIPNNVKVIRVHSSGDFFNLEYYQAWLKVATIRYDLVIFGYTKRADYLKTFGTGGMHMVYSHGGKLDNLKHGYPVCYIETPENEYPNILPACEKNPYDDFYFITEYKISFKLKVHGTQPKKGKK